MNTGCVYRDSSHIEGDLYLRHPAFNSYPTIGITHKQASDFCRWRTATLNAVLHGIYNKKGKPLNGYFNFQYRLPYHSELEGFAKLFYNNNKFEKIAPDISSAHYWCPDYTVSKKHRIATFSNIYEFTQNEDSLFYVLEKDTGLTFFKQVDETTVGKRHTGFRCVCEVKD
jgi:hypothetical protein